jgi:hypothetical protein
MAADGTADPRVEQVGRQPWLHDLLPLLSAPTQLWSGPEGSCASSGCRAATTVTAACSACAC